MRKSVLEVVWENPDGEEVTVKLPANKEICSRCDGDGTIVNPNIDGHGISSEEWENEWDEDSREMYMSGGFDVTCPLCKGEKFLLVPDEGQIIDCGSPLEQEALEQYQAQQKADAEYEALCRSEDRFCYGEY